MGILNKKERIFDTIVTSEGRRQIATGEKFKPTFVSFTDGNTFYKHEDTRGISGDAKARLYFEAASLPHDSIIFEVSDKGKVLGYSPMSDLLVTTEGGIIEETPGTGSIGPDTATYKIISGSDFASKIGSIITGSFENFKLLNTIGSVPTRIRNNSYEFTTNKSEITFRITNKKPFGKAPSNFETNINATKPLFYDELVGHMPNFQFLPPVTKEGNPYGTYTDLSGESIDTFDKLKKRIGELPRDDKTFANKKEFYGKNEDINSFDLLKSTLKIDGANLNGTGNLVFVESESVIFENTNASNNLIGQLFEINNESDQNKLVKLDLIDFGEFIDNDDSTRPYKRVYFAGKVMVDDNGLPCFINMFTIVFD